MLKMKDLVCFLMSKRLKKQNKHQLAKKWNRKQRTYLERSKGQSDRLQVGPSSQHNCLPLSQSLVAVEPQGHKHLAYIINVACTHTEVVQKGRNYRDRRHTIWSHLQGLEENNRAILTSSPQRCSLTERALGRGWVYSVGVIVGYLVHGYHLVLTGLCCG